MSDREECLGGTAQAGSAGCPIRHDGIRFLGPREGRAGRRCGLDGRRIGRPGTSPRRRRRPAIATGRRTSAPLHRMCPLPRSRHGGQDVNQAGRGRDGTLAGVQGTPHHALAQPAGRTLPAPGQVQRRADLAAPARGGRPRRPDLGGRLRPDGRDRRLRPEPRRQVRDLLRPPDPRRHARRAAHHGLGPPAGPLQAHQDGGGPQVARGPARPAPHRRRARRAARPAARRVREDGAWTPTPSASSA